jgi:two-component system, cell cycle sensor histidine kinase and response regulator CckA
MPQKKQPMTRYGRNELVTNGTADIAQRQQAETSLCASQAQMASIIQSVMDAIVTVDDEQCIVLFNTAAEQMFQCPAAEAVGQPLDRFIPQRFRHQQYLSPFGQIQVTDRAKGDLGAVYGLRTDGEEFPCEASISWSEAHGRRLFTVILRDITQRQRNEERLQEQAALLNEAQDAIISCDQEERITFWNRGAESLYGWTAEEVIGHNISREIFQDNIAQLAESRLALRTEGVWQGELRQFTIAGKEVIVESRQTQVRDGNGWPKGLLIINTNISEKKQLDAQFLRAQRLESLGTLAGGIAHDLNNILSPVLIGVQILQMRLTDADNQRCLEVMCGSVERGAELIKQILLFAKGMHGERVPLQTKHLIKETIQMLGETFPKSIEVKFSIPEELALVTGDATQIHQVLMNICVNARDAMPNGGRLLIEAINIDIDQQYAAFSPDARPGQYVKLSISDTGAGIPAAIKDKIFAPFFTTKELGKGSGLGLSTVLGIIKSHNGFINVYSEAGQGTKFTIYLPSYTTQQTEQANVNQAKLPGGHGELILVIDDEASIRELTSCTLEAFGYRAVTAGDGAEALAVYARHSHEIHAVLTDIMMPHLDGPATISALQKLNPQINVIASSGLAEQEKINEVAQLGVKHFLSKPYTADRLLKTLTELFSDQ